MSESGGGGSFQTGTGTSTFNGNVQISGANTLTTGTGLVRLEGNVQVTGTKTFSVGSVGSAGLTQLRHGLDFDRRWRSSEIHPKATEIAKKSS